MSPHGTTNATASPTARIGSFSRRANRMIVSATPMTPPWLDMPPRWIARSSQKGSLSLNPTRRCGS